MEQQADDGEVVARFLPLSHPPGEGQVDYGFAEAVVAGVSTKMALFVMSLPYADAVFVRAYTDTMCDLLRAVAARGYTGPVTRVLDNARYQRNDAVRGQANELGIELLFLPAYSPNLNLIERLWRFAKRKAVYGKYHPTFADFRAAIQGVVDNVPTTHAGQLATLMTLRFQEFENVSLLAA